MELPPSEGATNDDRVRADIESVRSDTSSRKILVVVLAVLFFGLNIAVIWFIIYVFNADLVLLKESPSVPRVVTTQVLLSLVGATVVQVGIAIISVVSYLFPKPKDTPPKDRAKGQ